MLSFYFITLPSAWQVILPLSESPKLAVQKVLFAGPETEMVNAVEVLPQIPATPMSTSAGLTNQDF